MSDINGLIHINAMLAFDQGRKAERALIFKAIDMCTTSNKIGDFVYIKDLIEHLEEVSAEVSTK